MSPVNAIHVFVYGTLRAGEANDLRVAAAKRGIPEPELLGTAMLHGRHGWEMRQGGWDRNHGHPKNRIHGCPPGRRC